jgi:hypothetical protein
VCYHHYEAEFREAYLVSSCSQIARGTGSEKEVVELR